MPGSCSRSPACPAVARHACGRRVPRHRRALRRARRPVSRWDRRRVHSGARGAGARALRPARVVVLRRPGGRRTGRPPAARPGRLPAGSTSAGRPARFHAAVHGAHRAFAVMLARNERSCHGRAASGGPVVTGLSSTSTSSKKPTIRSRKRSAVAGRTSRIRRDHPADPGVRAAARLQRGPVDAEVLGVVLGAHHPPGHRPGRGAHGDRRVLPHDRVPGRREQAADRVHRGPGGRIGADAGHRGPGGDRDPQGTAGVDERAGLLPRQHRVRDGEVGDRRRERAVLRHPRPAVGTDVGRDDAPPGLERDQSAGRRRQPKRAHAVVAVRQRHGAGGDGRGTAAGAARRGAGGVPRVTAHGARDRRSPRRGRVRAPARCRPRSRRPCAAA